MDYAKTAVAALITTLKLNLLMDKLKQQTIF